MSAKTNIKNWSFYHNWSWRFKYWFTMDFFWGRIFWNYHVYFGLCALEWGWPLCHLHLQMVCILHICNPLVWSSDEISAWMDWSGESSFWSCGSWQTFVGTVGYGLKNAKEEHFKVVDINVFYVKKNANIDEYNKFSAISTKNHVVLSSVNIIDQAFAWCKYWVKKHVPFMVQDLLFHLCYWTWLNPTNLI